MAASPRDLGLLNDCSITSIVRRQQICMHNVKCIVMMLHKFVHRESCDDTWVHLLLAESDVPHIKLLTEDMQDNRSEQK